MTERTHADPAGAYPPPLGSWIGVIILMALYVLSMLDRHILTLLLGPIKQDLNLTDFQISLLIGFAFALFFSLAGLPLGLLLDRLSRRKVIFVCVIIWSLATAGCGLATTFWGLFLARMIVGGGEAAVTPGSQSIIADLFPPTRLALPLSVFSLGSKTGQAVSLFVGGALAAVIAPAATFVIPLIDQPIKGWQAIFMIVGLPGVLIAFLIFAMPEPKRRIPPGAGKESGGYGPYFVFFRQNSRLIIFSHAAIVLYSAVGNAATMWAPAYFERVFHWSPAQIGPVLGAAFLLGALFGQPAHGYIADRLFQRGQADIHVRYMLFSALVGLPIGFAAYTATNPYLAAVLIGLFFFVVTAYIGLSVTMLQVVTPGHLRGRAAAIILLIVGMGGATLGPLIVAVMTDFVFRDPAKVGWSVATALALLLPIIAVLFAFALGPMRQAVQASTGAAPAAPQPAPAG